MRDIQINDSTKRLPLQLTIVHCLLDLLLLLLALLIALQEGIRVLLDKSVSKHNTITLDMHIWITAVIINSPGQLLTLVEVLEQGLDCAYSLITRCRIVSNIFGGCMCLHQRGPIGQRVHAQIDKQCQYLKQGLGNLIYG